MPPAFSSPSCYMSASAMANLPHRGPPRRLIPVKFPGSRRPIFISWLSLRSWEVQVGLYPQKRKYYLKSTESPSPIFEHQPLVFVYKWLSGKGYGLNVVGDISRHSVLESRKLEVIVEISSHRLRSRFLCHFSLSFSALSVCS